MFKIFNKPYTGGTLTITHKTGLDLTGATFAMKGQKPDLATEITKTATRVGSTDQVYATFTSAELDTPGEWSFQVIVTYSGAASVPCKTQKQMIYDRYQ